MNVAGDMWGETNSNRHIMKSAQCLVSKEMQLTCVIQNACEESMYFIFFVPEDPGGSTQ